MSSQMGWILLRDRRHTVVKNKLCAVRLKNGDYWFVRFDGKEFQDQWGGALSWLRTQDIDAYMPVELR